MNGLVIGALMALSMAQQTDTVFPVGNARRLDVETDGGSIRVVGWDRAEVRVQASHSSRTLVDIDRSRDGEVIQVETDARRGPAGIADFVISVPRALALELEGMYTTITVEGSNGEVDAETLQGDVTVRGGRGTVKVASTTGKILVEGAEGSIEAESTAGEVRFVDVAGDVVAESTGGNVIFERSRARSVDAGSTGGRVQYEGTLQRDGRYYFGSHGGSVTLIVPEGTSATLNLASIHGSITSNLEGEVQRLPQGRRHTLTVGGGGALVEIETFGGRIQVLRRGTEGAMRLEEEHPVQWPEDHSWADVDSWVEESVEAMLGGLGEALLGGALHAVPAPATKPR